MLHQIQRLLREEKGSVIVVIAIAFTLLLGFVALAVDTGVLYLEHNRLSGVTDAAALAGAQELPDTDKARTTAREYAQINGVDADTLNISFSQDNKEITVTTSKTVDLYFAKILGFNTSTVNGRSVAKIVPVKEVSGLIPLGINENLLPLNAGTEYMIKGGAQDGEPWRGIIKYPGQGNGGSEYRELVITGYNGTVQVNDMLGEVPGNQSGPTMQGVEDRINACSDGCTWNNYQPGCPRTALVPIYREEGSELRVVGFATVFLECVGGSGVDSRVWAKFIHNTISGETDDSVTDSYLNSVRLSE